jgi:hypothetical protein
MPFHPAHIAAADLLRRDAVDEVMSATLTNTASVVAHMDTWRMSDQQGRTWLLTYCLLAPRFDGAAMKSY